LVRRRDEAVASEVVPSVLASGFVLKLTARESWLEVVSQTAYVADSQCVWSRPCGVFWQICCSSTAHLRLLSPSRESMLKKRFALSARNNPGIEAIGVTDVAPIV
jgi:hypothetical protein